MRILYISQYFPPEMGAPSARVSELSRYWIEMGHEVTVLTTFPNYPDGIIYDQYKGTANKLYFREEINGVEVVRVWTYPTHLRSTLRRGLNYLSSLMSFSIAYSLLRRSDVIIATSPPPFIGLSPILLKLFKSSRFVFEVRDLWPEVISAVGAGNEDDITYKVIKSIVDLSYKHSDLIIALTQSFKDSIVHRSNIEESKIKVIENAVDTDFFKPGKKNKSLLKELALDNKFIVSYVGTIGLTHGVDTIIEAAKELQTKIPELTFILAGDGLEKNKLQNEVQSKGLGNVIFLGKVPRTEVPGIFSISDVSLVLSKKSELLEKTIFAKVFEPMASGIPVVVGARGETKRIAVDEGNAGLSFEPEDHKGLIKCLTKLHKDSELRKKLGKNGRTLVLKSYSRKKKAKEYSDILHSLVKDTESIAS